MDSIAPAELVTTIHLMNCQPRILTRLLAVVVALLTGFTSGERSASAAEAITTNAVVIELRDGSRLVGRLASDTLEFESEVLGLLRLPWSRVDEVRREGDPPRLVMLTRSGDRSTGELAAKELRLTTSFGEISLPRAELLALRPQRPVDATGLRHHWPGERDAQDSVGRGHGDIQPAVRFAPGRKGQAFTFNGQGEGVRFGEAVARLGSEDFTVAFWLRTPRPQQIQYVMSKRAACQPVPAWEVRCEPSGQMSFALTGFHPDFKALHVVSRAVMADDTWHHVVVTRSGRKVAIHLDGKLDAEDDPGFVFNVNNDAPLRLGSGVCAGQGGATHFTGQLDELRVFSRALKADDVEALFRADNSQ